MMTRMVSRSIFLAMVFSCSLPRTALAGTIGVTGAGDIISPASGGALADFFQDKTTVVHGWNERQNVILPKDIYVDLISNGIYNSPSDLGGLNEFKIAAGTLVSSHLLYLDPEVGATATNV